MASALLDEWVTSLKEEMNSGHAGLRESIGGVDRKLDTVVMELRSALASRADLAALDVRVIKLGDNKPEPSDPLEIRRHKDRAATSTFAPPCRT